MTEWKGLEELLKLYDVIFELKGVLKVVSWAAALLPPKLCFENGG